MNYIISRILQIPKDGRSNIIGLLIIIIAATRCTQIASHPQNPISNSTVTILSHPETSLTFTPTTTIARWTFTPTISFSHTPYSTWTPLPTLSDYQANIQWFKWLTGTSDCLLPCWGGITPGKTSWQEANQILESVINILDIDENHQCTFGPCKVIIWRSRSGSDPHGSVKSQNDTIAEIVLQGYPPSPVMRLDKILTQYGQPEKVFIVTNPVSITMDITLAYPNHGFIIMFRWDQSISHENIVGCIQERWVYLSVNQITETWSDSYIKNKLYGSGDIKEVDFRPLESVTNMSIEQFYEKFKNIDGSECIVAPIRIWQPEEEDDDPV